MKDRLLLDAVARDDHECVARLIRSGASANGGLFSRIFRRRAPTPLIGAAHKASISVVSLLIDAGADLELAKYGWGTPLRVACGRRSLPIVELLVQRGADVSSDTPPVGTPLETAAFKGDTAIVELLLRHGADPYSVVRNGPGSLFRIRRPVLACLVRAGAELPEEILAILYGGTTLPREWRDERS